MKQRGLFLILCLALALRVVGLGHSLPYRFVADTHVVRGALGMAQERSLAPPPKLYTTYPYLLPMMLLPPYAALYAGGKVTGAWHDAQDFGAKMVDDPTLLYWIARALTALLGVLGVLFTYRVTRRAIEQAGGQPTHEPLLAAYLVATSLMLVHLGKDTRPWVAVVAFVALTADRTLAWRAAPSLGRALAMGACAGLALACHQAGALAVLLPATAVFASLLGERPGRIVDALKAAIASAVAFGMTALLLGFPYLLKGMSSDVAVNSEPGTAGQFNLGGQSVRAEAFGLARFRETLFGFIGFEPALCILAVLGLFALRRTRFREGALPIVVLFPAATFGIFLFYGGTHTRYLVPAIPLLAILGAVGARAILSRGGAGRVAAVALLAIPLVQALRLDYVMTREDTRVEFLRTVAEKVPPHSVIAVEGYGPPLRFDASAVERLERSGQSAYTVEQREAKNESPLEADRPPYSVVPLERYYEFASVWPHQWLARGGDAANPVAKPVETFLDETGAAYVITSDRRPGAPRNSALDEVLSKRAERIAWISPGAAGGLEGPGEALLPMDPEFAATAIWSVSRPGPILGLWRIR